MPKLMISSFSIFLWCIHVKWEWRRNPSRESSNSTQSHIRLEFTGFYQSERLWVFSSPRTWALGPRTSCRENLRSVVNEESLMLILDTHNYAVAFFCSFDKRCKCFESYCFPLFLSLVLQFFQGKRRKRTDFLPGRRKDILFCYWFLKWDEVMGRENEKSWAI